MMKFTPSKNQAHPAQARGFSLVELMISITIGLILVAGMATLISNNAAHRAELEKSSRQIENGRYAMQVLAEDLRHAGYYGQYYEFGTLPAALPNPCSTVIADITAATPLAIQGYDAPSTVPTALAACLSAANHVSGTDILVVRRAATVVAGALVPGRVYVQTRSDAAVINDGSVSAATWNLMKKDGTTKADIRQFVVHIYFVSPCSVPAGGGTNCTGASDDGGKPIPTLKRLELTDTGGARSMVTVPLVEGIENLQIDYGTDSLGTGTPNAFTMSPADTTAWSNVVVAEIHLVARNVESTAGYVDSKTYNMGSAGIFTPAAAVQKYKRHAYTQLVRLENPSARREQ